MLDKCPGAASILKPTLVLKNCPECGEENELLSTEMKKKVLKVRLYDIQRCYLMRSVVRVCQGMCGR